MENKLVRVILLSLITALWIAGMVCLFLGNVRLGVILWAASFLAGFAVFLYQRHKESLEDVVAAEKLADKQGGKDSEDSGK